MNTFRIRFVIAFTGVCIRTVAAGFTAADVLLLLVDHYCLSIDRHTLGGLHVCCWFTANTIIFVLIVFVFAAIYSLR